MRAGNAEVGTTVIQSGNGSGYGTVGNGTMLLMKGQLVARVLASVKSGWQEKVRVRGC